MTILWIALSTLASAHIALEEPMPRYATDGSSRNKACPCGVGESNRLCDVEGDRSDPDRDPDRVVRYAPGATIQMTWRETIGHSGRYRVAFDSDGADQADFNDHILLDIPDPPGTDGNTGDDDRWMVEVTLPDTPCDNCTLQLIQVMDGQMGDPVPDPIGISTYYQCADIEIASDDIVDEPEDSSGCSTTGPASGLWAFCVAGLLLLRRRRGVE